ncbi:SPOR domain-containing protein [Streptomyces sp. Q6]|uniref:SPOR domain-containing protein n=1 Tax=Streptomyces citrinus TaxID=3118173 RepID=A0ACD5AH74_9ACTN
MTDSTTTLPWLVIRQDDNGNRYRVGRYATRAEAQRMADSLDDQQEAAARGAATRGGGRPAGGDRQLYSVERLGQAPAPGRSGTNGTAR